jgi:hypothetical protein
MAAPPLAVNALPPKGPKWKDRMRSEQVAVLPAWALWASNFEPSARCFSPISSKVDPGMPFVLGVTIRPHVQKLVAP